MELNPLITVISFLFGLSFFIVDYYESKHPILNTSLIAGISLAYFFLVVLPEVAQRLPEVPFHLDIFEYLFVLIGFSFIHVSEKFIIQRVETQAQDKTKKLLKMENTLEAVEQNIENLISEELSHEELDELALRDMARVVTSLHEQGDTIQSQIKRLKVKIHDHVNKNLEELRFFTNYAYHFLVGIIIFNLMVINVISAVLFFVFALFRAIISNRLLTTHEIFTYLDIKVDYEETKPRKILLASAALTGMVVDLLFDQFFPINIEVLYILFSFISGVILYTIVREVVPEKEKGNPLFFLTGLVGFTILILIINLFLSVL